MNLTTGDWCDRLRNRSECRLQPDTKKPRRIDRRGARLGKPEKRLSANFLNQMSQPGLVAVGVLLVNNMARGRSVQKRGRFPILDLSLFLVGFGPEFFDGLPHLGTYGAITQPLFVGGAHAFLAGLMTRQCAFPFNQYLNTTNKYNRQIPLVNH